MEDFPVPVSAGDDVALERRVSATISKPTPGLYYRAAAGQIREESSGVYSVDARLKVRIDGGKPKIVTVGGAQELRVALPESGTATVTTTIQW